MDNLKPQILRIHPSLNGGYTEDHYETIKDKMKKQFPKINHYTHLMDLIQIITDDTEKRDNLIEEIESLLEKATYNKTLWAIHKSIKTWRNQ